MRIGANFRRLWIGQTASSIGDAMFDTTLLLWISAELLSGRAYAPAISSVILALMAVVTVAVGPLAGVFVDRWDKKRTLIVCDLIRACLIGLLVLAAGLTPAALSPPLTVVIVALVITAVTAVSQFFGPARAILIRDVVPADQLSHASSYAQTGAGFAEVIGPPLAAPLFVALGAQLALGINAMSFVVSLLAIRAVRIPAAGPAAADTSSPLQRPGGSFRQEFRAGTRFIRGNRVVVMIVVGAVSVMLAAGAMNALDVYFVQENLHADITWFGLLAAAYGLGLMGGSFVAGSLINRVGGLTVFRSTVLLFGLLGIAYSRTGDLATAVAFNVLFGISLGLLNTAAFRVLLGVVPREFLGRTMSVFNPVNQLATISALGVSGILVGTVLRGFHATAFGLEFGRIDTVFLVCGLLTTAGGVAVSLMARAAGSDDPLRTHADDPTPTATSQR